MTTYINVFGGLGIGKSTDAARLFAQMKERDYNVELVTEVAKDFVWEERMKTLMIQPYVTIKQMRNLIRLKNKVEYVITDAPILLGVIYAKLYAPDLPDSYYEFIKDLFREQINPSINILLKRNHKYIETGRYQDLETAKEIDKMIEDMLISENIMYHEITAGNLNEKFFKEIKGIYI